MNTITVLYFGDLMNQLQIGRETLRLPPSIADVGALMRLLAGREGDWRRAFGTPRPTLRITLNKVDADAAAPLKNGDEVAFIESVSL